MEDLLLNVDLGLLPTPSGGFVHHLLRARDWQDRPEFGELCQWWRDGGVGVCALVGIGGAGKTAITERFLQVLPGGYPPHPKVPKDQSLTAPVRLLVFSFYDAPNPDTFFATLAAWLEGRPLDLGAGTAEDGATKPRSYYQTVDLLSAAGKCLLVLDGLEKVQDDGSRGGAFGQILDGRLRDFVICVADGHLPKVSLMITSRFRLYDPLASRVWYYRQVDVEKLRPPAAVQLLRDRGVRGTDEQLEAVAREQGFHALSVDLVGGYITRLCDGDLGRFSSFTPSQPEEDIADSALDPRVAALREQERKFARLTEQYRQALAQNDPASLALLQRVCLFRLGVKAETLASIFTGKGKESISGLALSGLNEQQLQAKLQLLVEMRLVEASKPQFSNDRLHVYTIHPAVRDGFLRNLDSETARLGHDAARTGLEASLGGHPGVNPSDPATLDLLEEVVFHTLAAGHVQEAWDIYCNRIGGYKNLGWRLGAYERGDRICRAFAAGQAPEAAPLLAGLPEGEQANFLGTWGLYREDLGQLAVAVHCHQLHIGIRKRQESWRNVSLGNQNLARVLLLAGRLTASLQAALEALQLAERANSDLERYKSLSALGDARSQQGDVAAASFDFRDSLRLQHEVEGHADWPIYGARGLSHLRHLLHLARIEGCRQATEQMDEVLREVVGTDHAWNGPCRLILAELGLESGDLASARTLLLEAHEWALQRDAKELLCWSALVRAKIELSDFSKQHLANHSGALENLTRLASALEDGLLIARECGYGIYYIDLLLVRAQLALHEGRASDAEKDVRIALEEGIHPPEEYGSPELLAATDPGCLYAWGIAEGRHLLGEALLLQVAQKLGQAEFVPGRLDRLRAEVRDSIDRAREQLSEALDLWRKLRDPESKADINPKGERTRRVIEQLDGGVLTEYPLELIKYEFETEATPMSPLTAFAGFDVFLSHNSKDKPAVRQLGEDLKKRGLSVWLDEWELVPGRPWHEALEGIVRTTRAAVVLVGSDGIGPWQDREMRGCLSEFVDRGLPVIPVLLPGAPSKPDLPMFLKLFTWVDLRGGLTNEGLDRIQWGITGKKPGS